MACATAWTVGLALSMITTLGWAEEWPQFRGPAGSGVAEDTSIPVQWDAHTNVQWQVSIPGTGWSSPIVSRGKVIVTTAVPEELPVALDTAAGRGRGAAAAPHRWEIYCLDQQTGAVLWQRVARRGMPRSGVHRDNTYASETPVTDGRRIYAYFGMHGIYCYDFDGELIWSKDLGAYEMSRNWGTASSPLLYQGQLFLQIDNEEESFLVALDARTGSELWREVRDERSNWSSPILWENAERTELVTCGQTIRSYDPRSGALLWQLRMGSGGISATPVGTESLLYVGSKGRGGGELFAVRAGAQGDITPSTSGESTAIAWSRRNAAPQMASPLVYDGLLYILGQRGGIVSCYDAATGELAYQERLEGARAFWASPWAGDGRIYCLDDQGTTHVLQSGAEFKVLGKNTIDGRFWASSAITDGQLLLRSVHTVYSIRR